MPLERCLKCGCFMGIKKHICYVPKQCKKCGSYIGKKEHICITSWNKNTKGICKPNSGSFKKGLIPWNKGKELDYMKGNQFAKGHKPNKATFKKGHTSWLKGTKGLIKHPLEWRELMSQKHKGKNNPNWKGLTPLRSLIRENLEYKLWQEEILKRDNYTCQKCGKKGTNEIHHIKSFSLILQEFLIQYSDFSPYEDKEILAKLATAYKPFWDTNNGMVLCDKCHSKTPNYKGKGEKKCIKNY